MKIANYFLVTLSLAVARSAVATAIEAASSSLDAHDTGDAVDAVEEATNFETKHKKINFDEVEMDDLDGYAPYPGNEDTGIIFRNIIVVDAKVLSDYYDNYADLVGYEMAATSKPNFGSPINEKPMKLLCRGGFFRLKSLRLTPVAQTFGRKIVSPRFAVMIKGVRNGKIVARKLVRLTLEDMNEAKEVTFDKKFDKGLTGVIFETFLLDPQSVNLYGVDDIKVKMLKRCAGLEEEKNSVSTSESSLEGSWIYAIVGHEE